MTNPTPAVADGEQTAKSRYIRLATLRNPFLDQARRCAELTIPYLLPPEGYSNGAQLPTPYQGVGSTGVRHLASKLLIALLPPNSPFFRLVVDPYELKKIAKDERARTALDAALSEIEQATLTEIETTGTRVGVFETLLHAIVAGNALLYAPRKVGALRVFHLDRYVVQRDPMGNVLTIITHESVAPTALPEEIRAQVKDSDQPDKVVDLYTLIERKNDQWSVFQEAGDIKIPGTEGTFPLDRCPYIPVRFSRVDGEDYGRGLVEQLLGDLSSLEGLSKAILEGATAAARIVPMVAPNGQTDEKALSEAENGEVITGRKEDVSFLQLEKYADFRVALEQATKIERRLETAFLLMSGVQRDAERVTAEEIRALVQELESGLGGVYSILSQELQLPLAQTTMDRMAAQKRLPKLPKKIVKTTVVTGVEALGRGNDLQKLDAFLAGVQQTFGPQVLGTYVNVDEYLTRRATALGVNAKGLVRSAEEVAAMQQQAQQAQALGGIAEKVAPHLVKQMGEQQAAAA